MSQGEIAAPDRSRRGRARRWPSSRGRRSSVLSRAATAGRARPHRRAYRRQASFGDPGLEDEALILMRDQFRRFAAERIASLRARLAPSKTRLIPMRDRGRAGGARRLRPDRARGLWRARPRQARDVRGDRGALARLYRRGLARHALGDRGRADPPRRHRGAEGEVAAAHRRAARSCRPPSSPSPAPAPTSAACAPAPSARATSIASPATRPGSPMPRAAT